MIRFVRNGDVWTCPQGAEKLQIRAQLPGAFSFDRASAAIARAAERGVTTLDLLPLAFASSWFVNNAAPSTVYRQWLTPPASDIWTELVDALSGGSWTWLRQSEEERQIIATAARALARDGHGLGAITKPLALLVPDAVPLMPDAALSFALGSIERPKSPDAQTAGVDQLVPMMDWFTREAMSMEPELEALARVHATSLGPPLCPAQVFDRLLWFDSVGYRHFRSKSGAGWFWVRDGERQGVVHVAVASSVAATEEPVDLHDERMPAAWREEARRALGL